ncbi:MAG: hypothetical protein JSS66_13575 [Armatimonadetes bacterium]|nr:hypothetical protein [Armatimonadota bacterium]
MAVSTVLITTNTPFQKAEALYKSAAGAKMEFTLDVTGRGSGSGVWEFRRPSFQRLLFTDKGGRNEYLQMGKARVAYLHGEKEYVWYPPSTPLSEPPPECGFLMRWADPIFLFNAPFSKIAPESQWKSSGTETIDGTKTDVLALPQGDDPEMGMKIWISPNGRLLRIRTGVQTPEGKVIGLINFKSVSFTTPSAERFEIHLPHGYVPAKPPKMAESPGPGERALLGKCVRWPSGTAADLAHAPGFGPLVVLFTSVDLEGPTVSTAQINDLRTRLKNRGVRFVQVWLGEKPPKTSPTWECFWDSEGSLEKNFGAAGTPSLYVFDKGVLKGGWYGWAEGDAPQAANVLLSALTKKG